MGEYIGRGKSGAPVLFNIKGEQPSQTEMAKISAILSGQPQADTAPVQPATPEQPGIMSLLAGGVARGWNETQAGVDAAGQALFETLGDKDRAKYWEDAAKAQRAERDTYAAPATGFTDAGTSWGDKGRAVAGTFGQSAPAMALGLGGMYAGGEAGALIGAPLGPLGVAGGAVVGGVLGGALGYSPQMLNANVERQQQEHPNKPIDWGKAFASTAGQAVIESATERLTLGVAGVIGKAGSKVGPETIKLIRESVTNALGKSASVIAKRVGEGAAVGTLTGATEEVLQQGLERWQADLPLLDDKAKKEYIESAVMGGILEGAFGAGAGVVGAKIDIGEEKRLKQLKDDHDAEVAAAQSAQTTFTPQHEAARAAPYAEQAPVAEPLPTEPVAGQLALTDQSATTREQKYLQNQEALLPKGLQDGEISQAAKAPPQAGEAPPEAAKPLAAPLAEPTPAEAPAPPVAKPGLKPDVSRETISPEAAVPGTTLKASEQGPVKGQYGSETEYRNAVAQLRGYVSVSLDRIKSVLGVRDVQAKALFDELLRRNDAFPAGNKNQYLQVTVPHGMETRTGSNESGKMMPQRSRDYVVKPVRPANFQPFSIELGGKKLGKLAFGTREEAQAYVDSQVPAGKKANATIAEDSTGMQYGIHELQYQHLPNREQQLVGQKVVNTFSTEAEANDAIKSYDKAYSPESNKWQERMPVEAKQAAIQQDFAQEMGPLGQQLTDMATGVVGKGRVDVGLQPTITALDTNGNAIPGAVVEGQARAVSETDPSGVKKVIRNLITLGTDLYNPNLTAEQRAQKLQEVLNHELVHVLRNLDLLTPKEWQTLYKAAHGNVPGKLYSWIERAAIRNHEASPGVVQEEAIAEMVRHYMNDPTAFRSPERGLFRRIADFIKKMMGLAKRHDAEDLMDTIFSGGVADRTIGHGGLGQRTAEDTFYSLVKPDNFYLDSARFLDGVQRDTASKNDWIKMLQNPSTGIKPSELDWLQLVPWLQDQPKGQDIRKADIVNYIRASGPKISTTVKAHLSNPVFGPHAVAAPVYRDKTQGTPTNYTEIAFTFPSIKGEPDFKGGVHATVPGSDIREQSSLYPGGEVAIPNVLAFARIRDVWKGTKKHLFVEEIQSDLHQQGSMNGYFSKTYAETMAGLEAKASEIAGRRQAASNEVGRLSTQVMDINDRLDQHMTWQPGTRLTPEQETALRRQVDAIREQLVVLSAQRKELADQHQALTAKISRAKAAQLIPNAPFKTGWEDYVIRRLIRHAAEHGYDGVVWHGSPESVAETEGYGDLTKTTDEKGRPQYIAGGPNGQSVTPIVNRYTVKLPRITGALADSFGSTVEHNQVRAGPMRDENGKPLASRGGYVEADASDNALQERWPDLQTLSADDDKYFHVVASMWPWRSPQDQMEAEGIARAMVKVLQAGRNMRQFNAADAIERAKVNTDHVLQFIRTVDTGSYYGTKAAETVGGEDSPFAHDHNLLNINGEMQDSFDKGDQPFFSMLVSRKREIMADPKFQNWFGQGVVTDTDGTPKVVYHSTRADENFSRFRRLSHWGSSVAAQDRLDAEFPPYVSGDMVLAKQGVPERKMQQVWSNLSQEKRDEMFARYWAEREQEMEHARIYPAFLNLRRPLEIMDTGREHGAVDYANAANAEGGLTNIETASVLALNSLSQERALGRLIKLLEKKGYDGLMYRNLVEDPGAMSYATFRPTQQKSIFNEGQWSDDPDIMYSKLEARGADLLANDDRFKHWFGGSRIVGEDGNPMLMFHGTTQDFDTFDADRAGASDDGWYGKGFYFSPDADFASQYARRNLTTDDGHVIPSFLSIKNPYIWPDDQQAFLDPQKGAKFVADLKRSGYDGIVVPTYGYQPGDDQPPWHEVVAFYPGQIKSALNKQFSTEDDSFKYSMIKPLYSQTAPLGQRVPVTPPIDTLTDIHNKMTYDNLSPVIHRIIDWVVPGSTRKHAFKEATDTGFISLQDRMLPVGRLIDRIKKNNGFISNENDTYLRQTLFHGQTDAHLTANDRTFYQPLEKTIQGLHVNTADYAEAKRLSANSNKILSHYNKNFKHALAELYLYARHAQERNAEMRKRNAVFQKDAQGNNILDANGDPMPVRDIQYMQGSGMADGEAQHILDWFASKPFGREFGDEANATSLRSRMRAVISSTNDVRVAAGLTPEFRGTPHDVYKDYVPLRGLDREAIVDDEAMKDFARTGKGFNIRGKEDMSALGRESLGSDLIAHALMQNQEAIVRAGKNKVTQSFRQLILDNPGEFTDVAEIMPMPQTKYALSDGIVREVQDRSMENDPKVLKGKIDGNTFYIEMKDPRIASAFGTKTGLGNVGMKPLIRGLAAINRVLASVRTSYNPEFMISNMLRDLQTAMINLSEFDQKGIHRQVMASVFPALNGVRKALRSGDTTSEWGKVYEEFRQHGGHTAIYGIKELADTIDNINKHFAEDFSGPVGKVKKPIMALGKFIEDYNLAIENGTRLATYKTLRDKYLELSGDPTLPANQNRAKEMAAFASKNLTVNFNMGGEYKSVMSALYLFFNASMQGSMAMVNPFIRSRRMKKVWGGVLLAGIMQDVLMAMLSPEDDKGEKEYDKIPDYILEHNMVFMDPFGISERGYFKLPMPYLMNSIHNWGRAISRRARGQYTTGQLMSTGGMTMLDSLNPMGGSNSFLNWVAPSVIDPIVDLTTNTDWTGKPVAPPVSPYDNTGINRSQQYWNNTNPAYVTIADWMSRLTGRSGDYIPGVAEVSPNQVEYVVNYLMGGTGPFLARAGQMINLGTQGTTPDLGEIPFVRQFTGSITAKNDLQSYVEGRDQVLRVRESLRSARKEGDNEGYLRIMREYPAEYKAANRINAIENGRKKLGNKINQIRRSTRLSDDVKAERIRLLKERQDKLVGTGNDVLSTVQ